MPGVDDTQEVMNDKEAQTDKAQSGIDSIPFVVGTGASAGGIEAFGELLEALPSDSGMAFIHVQHLDPLHESVLDQIFQRKSSIPVEQATDGMMLQPNHVYIIPPNKNIGITGDKLVLSPRKDGARFTPIDTFFTSLAEACGKRAIGVVLSGTGGDGTHGLQAIKAQGGLTFAQDQSSASYPDMPKNAVASGAADFVLPPAGIAQELFRLAKNPLLMDQPRQLPSPPSSHEVEDHELLAIYRLLQSATGIDFSSYKVSTIRRRISRRMMIIRVLRMPEYIDFLRNNPAEIEALTNDLFINVTSFFRDPDVFDQLREVVLPDLLKNRPDSVPLRVWVPGCSTGEEVYSLAISILETVSEHKLRNQIQIFATDISDRVIQRARSGIYPESIASELSAERLKKFFTRSDSGYQVAKSIRDLCIFSRHDLTTNPPFSRMDLISCRNLLIYLAAPQQQKIISTFHYALNPDGFLVLGSSESPGSFGNLFSPVTKKQKIYQKKQVPHYLSHGFIPPVSQDKKQETGGKWMMETAAFDVQREADRILLNSYAPASILINDHMDIIQFRGVTGRYVEPSSGAASLNLLKMLREGLLLEVRSLISRARKQNRPVHTKDVPFVIEGEGREVAIDVVPVAPPNADAPGFFLIIFREQLLIQDRIPEAKFEVLDRDEQQAQLQHDLHVTREYLQTALEDKDAMNEEFRSAIEEIQSSNEELQSTNEELETTKEELQSTNEELMTVNEEMSNRNIELSRTNDDLINLLNNVSLPLIILTSDLRIRRYTAMAEKILHLIPADVGRPFSDLRTKLVFPGLEDVLHDVLDTLSTRDMEVADSEGRWHRLKIRPYTTYDKRIDGVVLTLLDIDETKQTLEELRSSRRFAESVIQIMREPLLVLNPDLSVALANRSFYSFFQVTPAETEHNYIYNLGTGQWNNPSLRQLLEDVLSKGASFDNFEFEQEFPLLGRRRLLLNAQKLVENGGDKGKILLVIDEIRSGSKHE